MYIMLYHAPCREFELNFWHELMHRNLSFWVPSVQKKEWMSSWVAAAYCCFPPIFYPKARLELHQVVRPPFVSLVSVKDGILWRKKRVDKSLEIWFEHEKKAKALAKLSRLLRQEAKILMAGIISDVCKGFFFGWCLTKKVEKKHGVGRQKKGQKLRIFWPPVKVVWLCDNH